MDLIADYSDDGAASPSAAPVGGASLPAISAAPDVDTTGIVLVDNKAVPLGDALHLLPSAARMVAYNLPADQMHAPSYGPVNPAERGGMPAGMRNHWAGHAEDAHLSSYAFDEQFHTFHSYGFAADPGGSGSLVAAKTGVPGAAPFPEQPAKRQKTEVGGEKAAQAVDPTAPFRLRTRQPWAEKEVAVAELTEEQRAMVAALKEEKAEKAAAQGVGGKAGTEQSIFHGAAERDYQGRSWVEPPADHRREAQTCFLPKRCLHSYSGHTKGVNAVRFFPQTGHLMLTAGLDGKVKVWDVFNDHKVMRTYLGHSKGVRDAWFFPDGRQFVTSAYDKSIKVWDTETGVVVAKFGEGQMAYTVRCHPDPGEPSVLLAGMQNKKIVQFDVRTGDVVQEYDYHLGPVNTVTFIDENRRFMSTSDDKSIRVWEFGIPVQVKVIAEPTMHAISAASLSPNGKWWLGQSADNQIVTYSANDRVKQNRKKIFKGHTTAGYACHVGVSHDDRYVISGSGDGKLFVWDWKNTKILRSLKGHEGPCVGVEWHPLDTSKVATCGWDGLVKLWD